MLADDHAILRSGLRALLDGVEGIEVVGEAADVPSTRDTVRATRPDVLLLDLNMDGGSTLDLIRILLADPPAPRVVVLTMERDPAYARSALHAGAVGYVVKDAADDELRQAIRTALHGGVFVSPATGAQLALQSEDGGGEALTSREVDILRLVALGHTNAEISATLHMSVRSVEQHRARMARKLGCHSRADMVRQAMHRHLLTEA